MKCPLEGPVIRDLTEFILKAGLFQRPKGFSVTPGGEDRQLYQLLSQLQQNPSAKSKIWQLASSLNSTQGVLYFVYYHFTHLTPNKSSSNLPYSDVFTSFSSLI